MGGNEGPWAVRLGSVATLLYVFPHPDDESFGPAAAIARQRRQGHRVELLTLTRGGATKVRHGLGLSVEEMGAVREAEMRAMARELGLSGLTVLDLPDGGLAELDPRVIENVIREHALACRPEVVVTYAVHGISGFPDHLVTHAVVKRVWCELVGEEHPWLRRLALHTLESAPESPGRGIRLSVSPASAIDCTVEVDDDDLAAQRRALDCYQTYQEVIQAIDPASITGREVHFELFGEVHQPRLADLAASLPSRAELPAAP
jgi:N-acetylglucosamine malate deacetylase 2